MSRLLEVESLTKTFPVGAGLLRQRRASAVDGVSFQLDRAEVLGLVGESGSGKTTLARCILGLTQPDSGAIRFDGQDVTSLRGAALAGFRRRVQPVFQDPFASLDPRWTVGRSIRESLDSYRIGTPADRDARVLDLIARAGLPAGTAAARPRQLSGGQRQRVGIAAALASEPELIVADEPVSALDVSVQAQVLNLIAELRQDLGVAVLFIAHDLSVVEHVSNRVAVMYLGRVVELGDAADVFDAAGHPYTEALGRAIPYPDPARRAAFDALPGEIPSPVNPPPGCRFHPRCPLALDVCRHVPPPLVDVADRRTVACHVRAPAF